MKLRTRTALAAGRAAAGASRALGRGAGEVVGGKVALRLDPGALRTLAAGRAVATVSGTNGKTTTTRLLAAALGTRGDVVTNGGGANMPPGVVSALASGPADAVGVLEVDELHLPSVLAAATPRVAALLNLSRDQLDRANETRRIAGLWREAGASLPTTTAVANADDPLVVWAAGGFSDVTWVGAGQVWTADAMVCPRCAKLLRREARDSGSGAGVAVHWWCPSCGLERPAPQVEVAGSAGARGLRVDDVVLPVSLRLPGRCNLANAAVALASARILGVAPSDAVAAMEQVEAVAGRYATVSLGGRDARMLLAKNPAGWVEMIELLEDAPPRPVVVAFHARTADGRDPSWIYDVPAERLAGRPVLVWGDRADDLATRLAYAGVDSTVFGSAAEAAAAAPGSGPIDVLATYTAFRELLVETGMVAG